MVFGGFGVALCNDLEEMEEIFGGDGSEFFLSEEDLEISQEVSVSENGGGFEIGFLVFAKESQGDCGFHGWPPWVGICNLFQSGHNLKPGRLCP